MVFIYLFEISRSIFFYGGGEEGVKCILKANYIFSALNSLFAFTHQDHMTGRSFSFWKWYYGALDVVYRRLVDEWRDG